MMQETRANAASRLGLAAMAAVLLVWAASGLAIVPPARRAVYARFGLPVRVLQPGLHVGLPWPIGSVRRIPSNRIQEVVLDSASPAPPAWLAAADGSAVRAAEAEIRVLFRVGPADAVAAPAELVRVQAGRAATLWYAARTRAQALAANLSAAAGDVRGALQSALDNLRSGIEVIGVVITTPEAGREPADRSAPDPLQAAREAAAETSAASAEAAFERGAAARADAAAMVDAARTDQLRFEADRAAAQAGGQAFLLERYLAALDASLAGRPKVVIDHRLNWPEPPELDLRPLAAPGLPPAADRE